MGYTFLACDYWGKGHNNELKHLMLSHAFSSVDRVHFYIGEANLRSRRAVEKLGAMLIGWKAGAPLRGVPNTSLIYEITKQEWQRQNAPTFKA